MAQMNTELMARYRGDNRRSHITICMQNLGTWSLNLLLVSAIRRLLRCRKVHKVDMIQTATHQANRTCQNSIFDIQEMRVGWRNLTVCIPTDFNEWLYVHEAHGKSNPMFSMHRCISSISSSRLESSIEYLMRYLKMFFFPQKNKNV